ncbi:MAG: YibE/F family protein [Roseburia sp.]
MNKNLLSSFSFKEWIKKEKISLLVLAICAVLFLIFYFYANSASTEASVTEQGSYTEYETAKVTSVLSEDCEVSEMFENNYTGSQTLMIEITSGQYKGTTMSALNYLGALYGTHLKEGDSIVVSIYTSEGSVNNVTVYEYNRSNWVLLIVGVFLLVTVLIGGKKGFQSLLGLVLTIVCLIFILIPLLMKGFPTLLTVLLICVYVAVVSFTLLEGITKKTICAMIGTVSGLILAALFGLVAQALVKVNGMRMGDYVDALLQLKQGGTPLQLSGLLIGGMLIAALGAVMDVAMSIASSIQELVTVNPNLTKKDIWKSGMNIGKDMIGTMTNTLILAFVGSSFLLVIYIWSLNLPAYELFSSTLVATELVHSIASSIGVLFSVPLTVFISTFFFASKKK